MKTRYLAILATLAFLGFSVPAPALANPADSEGCHDHKPCGGGGDSSGGGKAFLFEIGDPLICGGPTDPLGASSGNVGWAGNVLWDPNFIHVHFKLQLKDVDPGTYAVFGNHDMTSAEFETGCSAGTPDSQLCEGGNCDLEITVKQNRQGRTSGVLRLPGHDPNETTTVWVTVTVNDGIGMKILRSTPVTVVLPPNEVGTE